MKRQLDWPALLLLIALLFGGLARFMPAFMTRFPINDGGMFYTMAQELSANGYALPVTTSYNGLDLPFAYPPLGLYLASLLSDASTSLSASLARIPLLEVFLWLPPLLSLLAIPAFYLLARALIEERPRAALATALFAILPSGYGWHIMGGGITRSMGLLFLLLATYSTYRLFDAPPASARRILAASIVFCSLAVLSHPEAGVQTAGLCALFWLFRGRTRRGVLRAVTVVLAVAAFTAPWWATVLARHGVSPFLSAGQTGLHGTSVWRKFLVESFASPGIFPFFVYLRLLGLGYALATRRWMLVALTIMPYLADPRSAPSISNIGFSLLSAFGILDAFPSLIARLKRRGTAPVVLESRTGIFMILALLVLELIDCGLYNYRLVNTTLAPPERAAMNWLRENLPPDQNFLILTGRPYSMSDPVQEWFPVLAGQHSQTTLQGLEWILGAEFTNRLKDLAALQACADIACVEAWANRTGLGFDYLWVSKFPAGRPSESTRAMQRLLAELKASEPYRLVYENASAAIFER